MRATDQIAKLRREAGAHLVICFPPEGGATCYPEGDLRDHVMAFAKLIDALHENPELIPCALGIHIQPHDESEDEMAGDPS